MDKVELEHRCPRCWELLASNNYSTKDWTREGIESDWNALVEYKKEKHSQICIGVLEDQFKL